MIYTLMHRAIPVMDIELDEITGGITGLGDILNQKHIPVGIKILKNTVDRASLNKWWINRSIPASRSGIREALEAMKLSSTQMLLIKCFGLSLSDQYWVCPKESQLEWSKVNFFNNTFSEDVGNVLFGRIPDNADLDLMSPDNTSDGQLKKKWIIADGKRCLVKGGSAPAYQEPLNEVLATAMMRRIKTIPYVPYKLIWDDNLPYSVCEDFITPQTELVSAWHILQTKKKENHISWYQHYVDCCEELGIPHVRESLDRMLTIDFLISNTDRHFNNFGAVRDAETLEWIGAAPVFDCGTSIWHNQATHMIISANDVLSKPFRSKHTDQIRLVTNFDWLDLSVLHGLDEEYAEILSSSPYIDVQRRDVLCRALKKRTEQLERFVCNQETKPIQTGKAEPEQDETDYTQSM